jgi:hypothetical protein
MVQAMRFVPVQIVHQQFIWHLFNDQSFFPSVRHCEILFFPCHENSCCFERLHSSILRGERHSLLGLYYANHYVVNIFVNNV